MTTSHTLLSSHSKGHINFGRLYSFVVGVLLWTLAITSVGSAAYIIVNKIHFARVLSGSMQPQFDRGDVLILKPLNHERITQGHVVMLPSVQGDGTLFVHRVVEVNRDKGATLVRTKGDANPAADPETLKITSAQVPLVAGVINMSWAPMVGINKAGIALLFVLLLIAFGSLFMPRRSGGHRRND
jgi:signal peptidase